MEYAGAGWGALDVLRFVLLLVFGAAMYGLVNELNAVLKRNEERHSPSASDGKP
jgi:hypothetical protein